MTKIEIRIEMKYFYRKSEWKDWILEKIEHFHFSWNQNQNGFLSTSIFILESNPLPQTKHALSEMLPLI